MERMRAEDLVKGTKYLIYHPVYKDWWVAAFYKNGPKKYFYLSWDSEIAVDDDLLIYSLPVVE